MRISFLLILLLGYSTVFAQVKMESEQDKDGNITIYGTNNDVIPYTLVITFTELSNLSSSSGNPLFVIANPGKNSVARLKKINAAQGTRMNFTSKQFRGSYLNTSKEEPVYLIPVQEGEEVRMQPLTHVENVYNKEAENKNYVGTAFYFDQPTVICAPRKGIISNIKMDSETKGASVSFDASDNFIEIYHEDGSFTKLMVLESGSEKIKIGNTVYPGQPLASSSGEKYQSGRHVRMIQSRWNKVDREMKFNILPVKVFDGEKEVLSQETINGMIVSHPEKLITKEMNKREIKRFESK